MAFTTPDTGALTVTFFIAAARRSISMFLEEMLYFCSTMSALASRIMSW